MDRIKGYENYSIDRLGNIYSTKGKKMKPSLDRGGYQVVWLRANGKYNPLLVHRLVALQYIPQSDKYVNHINGDKLDNRVENLEWCSAKYNAVHRDAMHPTMYDSRKIKVRCITTGEEFDSLASASKMCGGNIPNLKISIEKDREYKGYKFEYIN